MMLIKTSEPSRQIEKMLEKSARRRRLARRQDLNRSTLRAVATALSVATNVIEDLPVSSRVMHHARPHAISIKSEQGPARGRISRDVPVVTRWNVFGDMSL